MFQEEGEVVVGGMDEEDYNDADAMSEDEEPDEDVVIVGTFFAITGTVEK